MGALESAAGLNVRPAQDAALCLIALRHMNLRGDMPRERVCCVPLRASDKESGIAFIALFDARWVRLRQGGQMPKNRTLLSIQSLRRSIGDRRVNTQPAVSSSVHR